MATLRAYEERIVGKTRVSPDDLHCPITCTQFSIKPCTVLYRNKWSMQNASLLLNYVYTSQN